MRACQGMRIYEGMSGYEDICKPDRAVKNNSLNPGFFHIPDHSRRNQGRKIKAKR